LPSTPSSAEGPPKRSATEALASRYRHLFVLPSTPTLLLYSATASAALAFMSEGTSGALVFVLGFFVLASAAAGVSSALALADSGTIADFRRTCAVLLAGDVLWALFVGCGAAIGWLAGLPGALGNAFLFGAFVAAGFEFLVYDGVFTGRPWLAVALAAVHPAASFLVFRASEVATPADLAALLFGALAFAALAGFTLLLGRRKTSGGHDVLGLFRAFMKAWAAGDAADLEAAVADHSKEAKVTTKVLRLRTESDDLFLVLPGVHPGPFHPVGSYDLPGVVSRAFAGRGTALTLHRPGGHERNLATHQETERYAAEIRDFALTIVPSAGATMRGPLHAKVGTANAGATAFSKDLLLTVSFAPLGSDDLEGGAEAELAGQAAAEGFDVSVVDAHNSLVDIQERLDSSDPGWRELFERMKLEGGTQFRVGWAGSAELGFGPREDLTENGVGLVMFETSKGRSVLVLADANNAVPALRAEAAKALGSMGIDMIEFCTSDSHNLAAVGMTVSRGYKGLGEATPVEDLVNLVCELARLAEKRLSLAAYGSGLLASSVRVFGNEALEEFASVTQSTSQAAKAYFRAAAASVAVLFILSVVL